MISALKTAVGSFAFGVAPAGSDPVPVENRGAPRHETAITGLLRHTGADHPCGVRNVSTGGMTVAAPTARVGVGQQVVVVTDQMGALGGTVRWCRDGAFGIQFQAPMALDLLHHARRTLPEGMRPRAGRARISMEAIVRYGDFRRQALVGNISVGGLMMTTRLPLRPAQSLTVEFPDLPPLAGHVRWSAAGRCGVMFHAPLPITIAAEIARRAALGDAWLAEVRSFHDGLRPAR